MEQLILDLNEYEPVVMMVSGVVTLFFIFRWYMLTLSAWPRDRAAAVRFALMLLPVTAFCIFLQTLTTAASYDVVSDPFYIAFYMLLGFLWLQLGVIIMSGFFNLSWIDDVLNMDNKAALFAFAGGFIGLSIMYAASNIGDGPGWACVVFTGALGMATWTALTLIVNYFTGIFDRVTIERDIACGIRVGSFLLATAFIMGKKMAGDWVSVHMTVVDFVAAGPALASIIVELIFIARDNPGKGKPQPVRVVKSGWDGEILLSIIWGITLLVTSAMGTIKIYG